MNSVSRTMVPTVESEATPRKAETMAVTKKKVAAGCDGANRSNMGEAVGGAAAVCCCCPCAVVHLLVLALYKVPAGVCRRAWRKKKSLQRRRLLEKRKRSSAAAGAAPAAAAQPNSVVGPKPAGLGCDEKLDTDGQTEIDHLDLEHFYRGFWRSPSPKPECDKRGGLSRDVTCVKSRQNSSSPVPLI